MPRLSEAKKDVISCGEEQISCDPQISEWGNPAGQPVIPGNGKQTWGTETSHYPQEKKITMIPSVVASESGRAQTVSVSAESG